MLEVLAEQVLEAGCGTGVQLGVGLPNGRTLVAPAGVLWPDGPAVSVDTPFDLASLTKVVGTTCACLRLVGQGRLELDSPVSHFLGDVPVGDRTVRQLLGHRAGLVPWSPWFLAAMEDPASSGLWAGGRGGRDRQAAAESTRRTALASPPGPEGARAYSDLGFLVLGWIVEAVAASSLDRFVHDEVLGPLGLEATRFHRISEAGAPLAAPATGLLRPREPAPGQEGAYRVPAQVPPLRVGEVDDDNAWALDGVAGHAGLFGTAKDLLTLGRLLLEDLEGAGHLAPAAVVEAFVLPDPALGAVRGLGFDRPAPEGSAAGHLLGHGPRGAVGHLGFTGTSLWVDLDRQLTIVLLTNRTFPSRTAIAPIRVQRPRVHDEVVAWSQSF